MQRWQCAFHHERVDSRELPASSTAFYLPSFNGSPVCIQPKLGEGKELKSASAVYYSKKEREQQVKLLQEVCIEITFTMNRIVHLQKIHPMKRTLIITNLITLSLLAFVWIKGCRNTPAPARLCTTACYPTNSANDFKPLNGKLAFDLIENYRTQQWTSYKTHNGNFADARAVWFSLSTLKSFIHQIENSMCTACMNPKPDLGVRIYFGTYPDASQWTAMGLDQTAVDPSSALHHTLVMVPTYWDAGRNEDIDFDPLHMDTTNCRPMTMKEIFDPKGGVMDLDFLMPAQVRSAGMQNHGNTFPPPYDNRFENPWNGQVISNGAEFAGVVDHVL